MKNIAKIQRRARNKRLRIASLQPITGTTQNSAPLDLRRTSGECTSPLAEIFGAKKKDTIQHILNKSEELWLTIHSLRNQQF